MPSLRTAKRLQQRESWASGDWPRIVFREADPPRWNALSQRVGNQAREAQALHFATNSRGDCAQARDELGENFRRQRLVTIALGLLR